MRYSLVFEETPQNSWTTCTAFWIMNGFLTGFVSYADQAQFCSSLWNVTRPQLKLIYAAGSSCCLLRWYIIMPWVQILYLLCFLSFILLKFYNTSRQRQDLNLRHCFSQLRISTKPWGCIQKHLLWCLRPAETACAVDFGFFTEESLKWRVCNNAHIILLHFCWAIFFWF